jgi:uncharacterized membrane protein YcjF (UPF0283 family)
MANDTEQTLEDTVNEQRAIIARDIDQIREWLKVQAIKDTKDERLSASQRAMARRIFNRAMHVGAEREQATDQELDSYFNEAKVMREVVPVQIASVQRDIEDAARTICTIHIYADLVDEERAAKIASNSEYASTTELQHAGHF